MNPKAEALRQRTKRFALTVLMLARGLCATEEARVVRGQVVRSATAVGANYRACCRSRSQREFIARMGVALEEADESAFWIELVVEGRMAPATEWLTLLDEAHQLSAIFAQSRLTALNRLTQPPAPAP